MKFKFTGSAGQFIEGIPPRDLTVDEWNEIPTDKKVFALASGLYEPEEEKGKSTKAKEG